MPLYLSSKVRHLVCSRGCWKGDLWFKIYYSFLSFFLWNIYSNDLKVCNKRLELAAQEVAIFIHGVTVGLYRGGFTSLPLSW